MRTSTRTGQFKSLLERGLSEALTKRLGKPPLYEAKKLAYTTEAKYNPDFLLPNGVFLEAKGYFPAEDRRKMLNVIRCNPGVDIRMVFSNPNAHLNKKSLTTYAEWCDKNGIKWCSSKDIPEEWLR